MKKSCSKRTLKKTLSMNFSNRSGVSGDDMQIDEYQRFKTIANRDAFQQSVDRKVLLRREASKLPSLRSYASIEYIHRHHRTNTNTTNTSVNRDADAVMKDCTNTLNSYRSINAHSKRRNISSNSIKIKSGRKKTSNTKNINRHNRSNKHMSITSTFNNFIVENSAQNEYLNVGLPREQNSI